jgi:hypothetical protein
MVDPPTSAGRPAIRTAARRWPGIARPFGSWVTAAFVYAAVTTVMTWPLAADLAGDVPGDLGDPLLNAWILVWGVEHLPGILTGDAAAWQGWWNANIFHPEPLALAYSEHLFPQAVLAWPILALTGNELVAYNAVFLLTFVLSGMGMYILVRDLTGSASAGLVAGLVFAFVPYRLAQLSHLQVLSSQWMPFAIVGFRRFIERRSVAGLAGGVAALMAQQLSCGYYLLFFSPMLALYLLWELTAHRRWRDPRILGLLVLAAAVDLAVVWPFMQPYLELRELEFAPRSLVEVQRYSADVFAYLTATPASRVWGPWLRAYPAPEGDLFLGLAATLLAALGLGAWLLDRWQRTRPMAPHRPEWRWLERTLALVIVVACMAVVLVALTDGFVIRLASWRLLTVRDLDRPLLVVAAVTLVLLAVSPRARRALAAERGSVQLPAAFLLAASVIFSFGPEIRSLGRPLGVAAPYRWLFELVPGFDGLRVPARFGMLAALFLAILAGYGATVLRRMRAGGWLLTLAAIAVLADGWAAPLPTNQPFRSGGRPSPPAHVRPRADAPPVYRFVATLPTDAVILELPLGDPPWELQYVYYSSVHLRRLVNGYSGGFPRAYHLADTLLGRPGARPEMAWRLLQEKGVTHVIVHESGYAGDGHHEVTRWLEQHGARRLERFSTAVIFALPR